ncbi:MAG: signal peptidase I [Oscillospiraceae bacterium]|nr:signal peptidase I [Oscillospiraceae bacterium]
MCKQNRSALKKKDIVTGTLIVLLTALFILNFRFVRVDGTSMEPSLMDGRWLLTTTHTSNLQKNDIIVFQHEDKQYIKRIVAVEGDTVALRDGKLFINQIAYNSYACTGEDTSYTLSADEIFVLGDNASNSIDSRSFGPVKLDQVLFKRIY